MNNNDKIEKIKSEHKEMLEKVSNEIKEHGNNYETNCKEVIDVIEFDEKSIKKYEALVMAQEEITKLTEEISNANSQEEIIELRKKINYYINKIKSEIKRRNISDEKLVMYQEKASALRKSIAKYLRFIKRNSNIKEIERLNNNYENLIDEDKVKFKKMIKNELRYNARNNSSIVEKKEEMDAKTLINEERKTIEPERKNPLGDLVIPKKETVDPKGNNPLDDLVIPKKERPVLNLDNLDFHANYRTKAYASEEEYLQHRVDIYNSTYHVLDTYDYDRSFGGNLVNFAKNIPRYNTNKKIIRVMERDSCCFYHGSDLVGYIEYNRNRNSIRNALKGIFNKSYLYSSEGKYLKDHNFCIDWISNFCKENSLEINYTKQKVMA